MATQLSFPMLNEDLKTYSSSQELLSLHLINHELPSRVCCRRGVGTIQSLSMAVSISNSFVCMICLLIQKKLYKGAQKKTQQVGPLAARPEAFNFILSTDMTIYNHQQFQFPGRLKLSSGTKHSNNGQTYTQVKILTHIKILKPY